MGNRFRDAKTVQELIYQLVGAGSTCWWEQGPKGVFDTDEANAIAAAGVQRLGEILNANPEEFTTEVGLNMEFKQFIRKPFLVEAIEVTRENIADLSDLIGEYGHDENGPFIEADRDKVPTVYRVTPGYWVTKMGRNIRCYSARVFAEQFIENTPVLDELMQKIEEDGRVGTRG